MASGIQTDTPSTNEVIPYRSTFLIREYAGSEHSETVQINLNSNLVLHLSDADTGGNNKLRKFSTPVI